MLFVRMEGIFSNYCIYYYLQSCTAEFEEAGGLSVIEPLEYHKDESIKSETNALLEKYFYKEDKEPETAAAVAAE